MPRKVTLPIRNKVAPQPEGTVLFKKTFAKYGCLSNFYPSPILIDGILYHHVEGYYQSQKFIKDDIGTTLKIQSMSNPADCKRAANAHPMTKQMKQEWDSGLRITVMKRAVLCKFLCNTDLATTLMSTGNSVLVEDAVYDGFWGTGSDGNGTNMLGKVLMETRDILNRLNF